MKNLEKSFFRFIPVLMMFMAFASPVFAAVEEAEDDELFFIEVIGVIIAIVALVMMIQVAKVTHGGAMGKTFKYLAAAFGLFAFSVAWQGFTEFVGMKASEETYFIGSIPVYIGFILGAVGAWQAKKALESMK